MRRRKERRLENLVRRYVGAKHEYEECVATRDWYGAEYALELSDFLFSRLEAEVGRTGFVPPAPPPRTRDDSPDELMAYLLVDELTAILDAVVGSCERDGFGAVYSTHNGELTAALAVYEAYKNSTIDNKE